MRTLATIFAALALSAAAVAQETIVIDEDATAGMSAAADGCGCGPTQSPPWHASVAGDPCGPCCPPPTLFHANPCEQLHMKHAARLHGYVLPPCFPRMHTRLTEGHWPTPRPIKMPRCPRCGAHIEGGF